MENRLTKPGEDSSLVDKRLYSPLWRLAWIEKTSVDGIEGAGRLFLHSVLEEANICHQC